MKKKWIFVVVVAILIIAGVVGIFMQQGGKSSGEKALGPFPGHQSAGSAPEIKYVPVAEAKGLEVEPKVVVEDWKQGVLSATVKIKNTRGEMLVTAKLNVYMNQSKSISSSFSVNKLKSGETTTLNLEMLEVTNVSSIKKVEVSFNAKSIIWEKSASAGKTAVVAEPEQPEKTVPSQTTLKTPEEIVAEWFNLMERGKFSEALKLYTLDAQNKIKLSGGEKSFLEAWQKQPIKKLKIEGTEFINQDECEVDVVFYYEATWEYGEFGFSKNNGQWKINKGVIGEDE